MPTLEEQLVADANGYEELIQRKFDILNPKERLVPVTKDVGDAYMQAWKEKKPQGPHVLEISRKAIAYLYKKLYDEAIASGQEVSGNLAIGFSIYDPQKLPTPSDPQRSDPNWKPERKNKDSVMLGISTYDSNGELNGIKPFKGTVIRNGSTISVDFYDDWHNEDP